jgi:NitT/TauT family transport system ATP-binding protein
MDEPFSALDAQTRELLIDDFLHLWAREKLTAIYITHNLEEAIRTADRILVLCRRPGRIKDLIEVPIPQSGRQEPNNRNKLSEIEHHIWSMIRQEAIIANEEVADA